MDIFVAFQLILYVKIFEHKKQKKKHIHVLVEQKFVTLYMYADERAAEKRRKK